MNKSIIAAAVIIAAAIFVNGHFERASRDPHFSRPSENEVSTSITQSFDYALKAVEGDNVIMNKKRDVQKVLIDAIRYSHDDTMMLVDVSLLCADGDKISSGVSLSRDDFGVYRGSWEFGRKRASFEIKKHG